MALDSRYRVIATAGHVDHGKSALVKALTGVDPDRLREEQERQMTIDLGFARLDLPSGTVAGIVDVPGHRDFIHNMLAGLGGIDAVLLVVAADEGMMPQTREHLAILDLLNITDGVAVITKADLVDEEWLTLVQEEVGENLLGTSLESIPTRVVSAVTGQGLAELVGDIDAVLARVPPPADVGRPRLPLDRVFSLRGHGTVVTGTLLGGALKVGDLATLLPGERQVRVRSLQTHGASIEEARPGSRVAANLVGVQTEEVERGQVLTKDGWLTLTGMFDARVRCLQGVLKGLEHAEEAQLFAGALDVPVRLRLLEAEVLAPGEMGWAQVVPSRPIPVAFGDRFILRRLTPSQTIGGGLVVDAHPGRRHRRNDPDVWTWLELVSTADESAQAVLRLRRYGLQSASALARLLDVTPAQGYSIVQGLAEAGQVALLTDTGQPDTTLAAAADDWADLTEKTLAMVGAYHEQYPVRIGIPREELRRGLRLRQMVFVAALERWLLEGRLTGQADRVRLPSWRVELRGEQQARAEETERVLRAAGTTGVGWAELAETAGEDLLGVLQANGRLVRLADDIVLGAEAYEQSLAATRGLLESEGAVSVAQVRDALGSNRRSTLALLAHLDDRGITRREGDHRVKGRRFAAAAENGPVEP